eukprot:TRINITY_DN3934_c0_g1_i5.p7 TRINITY_DN3934_c0_g1~~TRINITY_DN3934_c0_g1_i5.p7  ORF type:complete len:126 (+),score=9.09 TRINITY_DN3934_c0_g1_i5:565-942(+)
MDAATGVAVKKVNFVIRSDTFLSVGLGCISEVVSNVNFLEVRVIYLQVSRNLEKKCTKFIIKLNIDEEKQTVIILQAKFEICCWYKDDCCVHNNKTINILSKVFSWLGMYQWQYQYKYYYGSTLH